MIPPRTDVCEGAYRLSLSVFFAMLIQADAVAFRTDHPGCLPANTIMKVES